MTEHVIEVSGLVKKFGGLTAVNEVSLAIERGAIHGLIGPNGSGKSTFINCVTGVARPDAGQVVLQGRNVAGAKANVINAAGVARTFQNLRMFGNLTVLENVLIGQHRHLGYGLPAALLMQNGAAERRAHETGMAYLADVGLAERAHEVASSLPYGEQRLLEIARALATRPKLLMLDEPLAGMNPTEMDRVMRILRRIVDQGISILLVEHAVRVIMAVCDRITVLSFGRRIAEGTPGEIQSNDEVITAYLGRRRNAV